MPNSISIEAIKHFCGKVAQKATHCKYDPFVNSLYLQFSNYDDYNQSCIDTKKGLKDQKSEITFEDFYSFKSNYQIDIMGTLSFDTISRSIVREYKGKKNILLFDQNLHFISNEDIEDVLNKIPKLNVVFSGGYDSYNITLIINDDSDTDIISLYSQDYLSLIKVLEKLKNISPTDCFKTIRDIEASK